MASNGVNVTRQTVVNTLRREGLRRPKQFATEMLNKEDKYFNKILWSDLIPWRQLQYYGLRRIEPCLQTGERHTNGEAWWRQHQDLGLFFIRRHRRSTRHKNNNLLQEILRNFRKSLQLRQKTQHGKLLGKRPSSSTVTVLEWPGKSPEFNSIEIIEKS